MSDKDTAPDPCAEPNAASSTRDTELADANPDPWELDDDLEYERKFYESTGNPLFVWRTIKKRRTPLRSNERTLIYRRLSTMPKDENKFVLSYPVHCSVNRSQTGYQNTLKAPHGV